KISSQNAQNNSSASKELASGDRTRSNPMEIPEIKYRGRREKQLLNAAQKKLQDSTDAARLREMATPKPLSAPDSLSLEPLTPGQIVIRWNPAADALSYIVEMKKANDA